MDAINAVLARKLGLTAPPVAADADEAVPTPTRLMRRALARAADKSVGLTSAVLGIAQEDIDAEDLIETGPTGWIVLGLRNADSAGLTGLFLMDPALRSALIEIQTMGSLLPPQEEQRRVTRTDAVMCLPFAEKLLSELETVGFGGDELSPGSYDTTIMTDLRTAGLVMVQGLYRQWRISVEFGGEAQGEIILAMSPKVTHAPVATGPSLGWSEALRLAVQEAPAELDAVLCNLSLPIEDIEAFEVGQVLNLAGTTVDSVKLVGPGGEEVAMARLGQVAGKRAVRIEDYEAELQPSPTPRAGGFDAVIDQEPAFMGDMDGQPDMDDPMMAATEDIFAQDALEDTALDVDALDVNSLDVGELDVGDMDAGELEAEPLDVSGINIGTLDIGALDDDGSDDG